MTHASAASGGVPGRRGRIADAAIAVIARDGLRALTHRAVDREAQLPAGSTSYYCRSRRDLLEAVVHRLAGRTSADLRSAPAPLPADVDAAARRLGELVELLATRSADQRTRFALLVDLADDAELHPLLSTASPIRASLLAGSERLLGHLGCPHPETAAPRLVAVVDGLVFERSVGSLRGGSAQADVEVVLRDYLRAVTTG
jgi:DNA-binding transcriptional regulator YbjK